MKKKAFNVEISAILTVIGIVILFSSAIFVTLIVPGYVDPSWTANSSSYQKQMYEIADPNTYISSTVKKGSDLQFVYHLREGFSLLSFQESQTIRIIAPEELKGYVTKHEELPIKLTSDLLLLRKPQNSDSFQAEKEATALQQLLQQEWREENKDSKALMPHFVIYELFKPNLSEAFSVAPADDILENWVDKDFVILDKEPKQEHHKEKGVIYVYNPVEYRVQRSKVGSDEVWRYSPEGDAIASLEELTSHELGFRSRKELISLGEHIFAIEGCWYCHTDQTRTLIQDLVLNGTESYPAPPSSANEYIYQRITFPGTKRNGPDLSRVGVKRPNRDWHKSHFWSPKTESKGSIMPAFQHFFDSDPRGTSKSEVGIPNYKFEAIFQYLLTKGTRITPPTEAWWHGKDPLNIKEVIDGQRSLP